MALFPSFSSGVGEANLENNGDLDTSHSHKWLQNSSFKTSTLLEVEKGSSITHQFATECNKEDVQTPESSPPSSPSKSPSPPAKKLKEERKRKKEKHRHTSKHKKSHREENKNKDKRKELKAPLIPPPKKVFIEEIRDLGYKDAYRLDRTYDRDNYRFSSLNKNHIARYKLWYRLPLGIARSEIKFWLSKRNVDVHLTRYCSRKQLSDVYQAGQVYATNVKVRPEPPPAVIDIPPPLADDSEKTEDNPLGIYDTATALWSVGKSIPSEASDQSEDTLPGYLLTPAAQKITACNRELRERPADISLWLELIDLQDGLIQHKTDDEANKLFTEQGIHDKKLAIVEQALKKNPSNLKLLLKQLELSSRSMDWSELNEQWKSLTFTHINDIDVWRGYLTHIRSNFSKFTVKVMMKAYTKCLKSLRRVRDGILKSHPPLPNTETYMIECLFELCDLLHLANCTEKSVAILQSMIEFNMYRPANLPTYEEGITQYQQFYDAGHPVFGESGAKGWRNQLPSQTQSDEQVERRNQDEEEEELIGQNRQTPLSELWLLLENSRQINNWLPWKPAANETEDDCLDPNQVVVSDDFIELLFYIEDDKLRESMCLRALRWFQLGKSVEHPARLSGINQIGEHIDSDRRCETTPWCAYAKTDSFLENCMQQLSSGLTADGKQEITVMQLWLKAKKRPETMNKKELKRYCKEFRSYAKSVLSHEDNRTNNNVWLEFAACYEDMGLYEEMTGVYDSIIASETNYTRSNFPSSRLHIYWEATNAELSQAHPDKQRLLRLASWFIMNTSMNLELSSLQKLQALRELERLLDEYWSQELESRMSAKLSHFLPCYFLLEVAVNGLENLESALSHWIPLIQDASESKSTTLLDLFTRTCKVLEYIQKHLYQSILPILRQLLQTSIALFPTATALLDMYIKLEHSVYSLTKTRQLFTSTLSALSNKRNGEANREILAVYSILYELQVLARIGSNSEAPCYGIHNRIRSLCEKCVHHLAPHSVLIWRMYLYHEAKYGEPKRVMSLFYAAIQSCPYSKCLYMDCIRYCPDKMEEILDIAEEKEIRIHIPIDELKILTHVEPEPLSDTQQSRATS